jgi:hypothetical protein
VPARACQTCAGICASPASRCQSRHRDGAVRTWTWRGPVRTSRANPIRGEAWRGPLARDVAPRFSLSVSGVSTGRPCGWLAAREQAAGEACAGLRVDEPPERLRAGQRGIQRLAEPDPDSRSTQLQVGPASVRVLVFRDRWGESARLRAEVQSRGSVPRVSTMFLPVPAVLAHGRPAAFLDAADQEKVVVSCSIKTHRASRSAHSESH